MPDWKDVSPWPQMACGVGSPGRRSHIFEWGGPQSSIVTHFLRRILDGSALTNDTARTASTALMKKVWAALRNVSGEPVLSRAKINGTFRLNPRWLRFKCANPLDTLGVRYVRYLELLQHPRLVSTQSLPGESGPRQTKIVWPRITIGFSTRA